MIPDGVKGIIFDYGGTLDTGGDHWATVIYDAWRKVGINVDINTFKEAYILAERYLDGNRKVSPDDNFKTLIYNKTAMELKFAGLHTKGRANDIGDICYRVARCATAESALTLSILKERYKLAVVSNFYGNLAAVLKDFGICRYFDTVVDSAVVGLRKPDPAIFTYACDKLGVEPSEVLVVGDSMKNDILPASQAGCRTVLLKGRLWFDAEEHKESTKTIKRIDELVLPC